MPDVVVIGAGISGAATAYELARAGLSVVLLDRYGPAAMASGWTLAGVRQSGRDPAELPLARAAVAIWDGLAEQLDAPTHYRRGGNLRLARDDAEIDCIERLVRAQSAEGLGIQLLRGDEVRAVAPAVSPAVRAASFCPSDGHADPRATVLAYVAAAERLGVVTRFGERALAIEVQGGRVTGVRTDAGTIAAGHVVLAAGIFGNELLNPLGLSVPMEVRAVTVVRSSPVAPVLAQVIGVANAESAGRQEASGRFRFTSGIEHWRGAIEEVDGAPVVRPSIGDVADTIARFASLVPAVRAAPLEAVWAGLIDQTPDALPVIQAMADPAGLVVAMGFSGHGFCLGPVTGRILASLVQGQDPGLPIEPFRLERFSQVRASPAGTLSLHG